MVEPIVYVGIGLVLAVALALAYKLVLLHARRTALRVEDAAPNLLADIEADMEVLHGQVAVATRRLEMSVAHMKSRTAGQLAEIGKSSEAIARLKAEQAERSYAVAALTARHHDLASQLRVTEGELAARTAQLEEATKSLADRKLEFKRLLETYNVHPEIKKIRELHDHQLEAANAEKAALAEQLAASQRECARLEQDMARLQKQIETTWASERMANAVLRERINDVASEVVRVAVALEGLNAPVEGLVAGRPDHGGDGALVLNGPDAPGNGAAPAGALANRLTVLRKHTTQLSTGSSERPP